MIAIRSIQREDAERLLQLHRALDVESSFMLLEPDERSFDLDEQRRAVERFETSSHQHLLVADAGDRLAGFLVVSAGAFRRNRRTASVVIGVARAYWRRGVATRLFAAAEAWAHDRGVRRLELTVMSHNRAALALYRRLGFDTEGTRRAALEVDGAPVDEIYMGKLLQGDNP